MDYTVRYGLEFNPFLKNSKEIFVSTAESKEAVEKQLRSDTGHKP